jgi:hypothetical protein
MWKRDAKGMPPTSDFFASPRRVGAPLMAVAIENGSVIG